MEEYKPTILIVDDQPDNIRLLSKFLERDYTTLAAINGPKALGIARSTKESGTRPDLILLDVMMPEMDGYEVCRLLKEDPHTRDIPVIFLTARDQLQDETKGLELGAVDYLIKPFRLERLVARLKTHLNTRRRHQEELNAAAPTPAGDSASPHPSHGAAGYENYLNRMTRQINSAVSTYSDLIDLKESDFHHNMAWRRRSVDKLGGDFIGIQETDTEISALVADVAGHDMGASFHTVLLKAFFEENRHARRNAPDFFHSLNRHIMESSGRDRMITALFLNIDLAAMRLEAISAAHPWLAISSGDERETIMPMKTGGHPIGLKTDPELVSCRRDLTPGDRLFLFTDGVPGVSRLNTGTGEREKLDNAGVLRMISEARHLPLADAVGLIWDQLLHYCRFAPKDDILLFGVEIPGNNSSPSESDRTAGEAEQPAGRSE